MKISLDFETRSRCDIRKCGSYKYAEDPSTEVLILAVAETKDNVLSWDISRDHKYNDAIDLLATAIEEGWEIHAFNSQFEWAIMKYVLPRQFGFPVPDINTIRCSQALCRRAGVPAAKSLAKTAEFLKVADQKDRTGHSLIRKFSIPQKDGTFVEWDDDVSFTINYNKMTAREAFQLFVEYCEQDVRTEMAVAEVLKSFTLKGFPLECFLLTARLNDRGVPVDREALKHADFLRQQHDRNLQETYREITGLSPNQNAKSLEWMKEQGYPADSLDKAHREAYGDDPDLSEDACRALQIKGDLSFAAVKKIPAMLDRVMSDGKIRGSFTWCGAQKTWRWTSETPQWQNMKKPSKSFRPNVGAAYLGLERGWDMEMMSEFGDPYEVLASLARYFVRFPDCDIFDTDYSSVEARILPALIEAERILNKIRTGEDIYVETGSALAMTLKEKFDIPFTITRDTAKTVVLATQFGGGWHAVFTATGQKWEKKWCQAAAKVVREENPEFRQAWNKFQDTFIMALDRPNHWFHATSYVSFAYVKSAPYPRILMRLPSGRAIVYPLPEKAPITMVRVGEISDEGSEEDEEAEASWVKVDGHRDESDIKVRPNHEILNMFHTWELSFEGHIEGAKYGRVKTYGGDLLQSATQGTGVDFLAYGALEAERQGFGPFFLVHDQCLTPARGDKDQLTRALCKVPEWFKGFPLEAETDVVRSYCKQ